MTTFYLVRHGEAWYQPIDERGFIGHGRDLAPLTDKGIDQIKETSKNEILKDADIIIVSPYTRAMHSGAILSKELNIGIEVEVDLHEWIPDIVNFQHKTTKECVMLGRDFTKHNGIHPENEEKVWETHEHIRERFEKVLDKYMEYDKVIVVCHGMVIRTVHDQEKIGNGEVIVYEKEESKVKEVI